MSSYNLIMLQREMFNINITFVILVIIFLFVCLRIGKKLCSDFLFSFSAVFLDRPTKAIYVCFRYCYPGRVRPELDLFL